MRIYRVTSQRVQPPLSYRYMLPASPPALLQNSRSAAAMQFAIRGLSRPTDSAAPADRTSATTAGNRKESDTLLPEWTPPPTKARSAPGTRADTRDTVSAFP